MFVRFSLFVCSPLENTLIFVSLLFFNSSHARLKSALLMHTRVS